MDRKERWTKAVEEHRNLVRTVVRELGIRGAAGADACQEGLIALRKIAESYNPDQNVAFSTYARRALVRHIIRHRKGTHHMPVPHSTAEKVASIRVNPDAQRPLDDTVKAVDRAMRIARVPLDDVLAASASNPHDEAVLSEEVELLRKATLKLPAKARYVLISHLGLFGAEAMSIAALANEMEIKQADVQAIFNLAQLELREIMRGGATNAPV